MFVFLLVLFVLFFTISFVDQVAETWNYLNQSFVEDWFWAYEVEQKFYLPAEMEGWPTDDELEAAGLLVAYSVDGVVRYHDYRDWADLQFSLEVGWSIAETTWVEEADADPVDDGIVLIAGEKSYVPKRKDKIVHLPTAEVIWEHTPVPLPDDLQPQLLDEKVLKVLGGQLAATDPQLWQKKTNETVKF